MSRRSLNETTGSSNPATKFLEWKSNDKCFAYYDKEAKERFSLGQKVTELVKLNEQISQDAINLTNALKGEAKTQGNWGELQLEKILERAGLEKGIHYEKEHNLKTEEGADIEGYIKRMNNGKSNSEEDIAIEEIVKRTETTQKPKPMHVVQQKKAV